MTFETESFEDLSKCSNEKLVKLRDVAADYVHKCYMEHLAAEERYEEIDEELSRRG